MASLLEMSEKTIALAKEMLAQEEPRVALLKSTLPERFHDITPEELVAIADFIAKSAPVEPAA